MNHFSGDINNSMTNAMRSASSAVGKVNGVANTGSIKLGENILGDEAFINLINELDKDTILEIFSDDECKDIFCSMYPELNIEDLKLELVIDDGNVLGEQTDISELDDNIEKIQSVLIQQFSTPVTPLSPIEGTKISATPNNHKSPEKYKGDILVKLHAILEKLPANDDVVSIPAKQGVNTAGEVFKTVSYIVQSSSKAYTTIKNKSEKLVQNYQVSTDLQSQSTLQSQQTPKPVTHSLSPLMKAPPEPPKVDLTKPIAQDNEVLLQLSENQVKEGRTAVKRTEITSINTSDVDIKSVPEMTQQASVNPKHQYHTFLPVQQLSQRIILQLQADVTPQGSINIQRHLQAFQEQSTVSYMDVQLEPEGLGVVRVRMSMISSQLNLSLDFSETDTARYFKHEEKALLSIIKNSDVNMNDVVLRINETSRNAQSYQRDQQDTSGNSSAFSLDFSRQDRQRNTQDNAGYEFEHLNIASDDINNIDKQNENMRSKRLGTVKYI